MDLSIIIVSFNTMNITCECVKSVVKHTKGIYFEIIVVDNASRDDSVKVLRSLNIKNLIIIKNKKNIGFGSANNQGMKIAKGNFILLLNSDTKVYDNVIGKMVLWQKLHPEIGIASCALKNPDGTLQDSGGYFPTLVRVFSWMTIQDVPGVDNLIKPFHPMKSKSFMRGESFYKEEKELDWVTGAFFLMSKEVFEDVGFFDSDYFMYMEEVDYCYEAKKRGWRVYYLPSLSLTHIGGASGTKQASVIGEYQGIKRFFKKHYSRWQYPLLRILLKIGSLGRIILFGIVEGKESASVYAKAFKAA